MQTLRALRPQFEIPSPSFVQRVDLQAAAPLKTTSKAGHSGVLCMELEVLGVLGFGAHGKTHTNQQSFLGHALAHSVLNPMWLLHCLSFGQARDLLLSLGGASAGSRAAGLLRGGPIRLRGRLSVGVHVSLQLAVGWSDSFFTRFFC